MKRYKSLIFTAGLCLLLSGAACSNKKPDEKNPDKEDTRETSTGQQTEPRYHVYIDIGHKQVFWNDPTHMSGMPDNQIERAKYMTNEITTSASPADADIKFIKNEIDQEVLEGCDILFIHIPKGKYKPTEVDAITNYVKNGGSLFLIMDADYWSTLNDTNVNDLIRPFDIQFDGNSPDSLAGGYTKANPITNDPMKITYHGGRIINGGTPFCYNKQTEAYPFGVFKELGAGGKLVVMGDGMASLYMTSWQGVNGYPCQEFMQDVFKWLLKKD